MNDTKMIKLNQKEERIINIFLQNKKTQFSGMHSKVVKLGEENSFVITKRTLQKWLKRAF